MHKLSLTILTGLVMGAGASFSMDLKVEETLSNRPVILKNKRVIVIPKDKTIKVIIKTYQDYLPNDVLESRGQLPTDKKFTSIDFAKRQGYEEEANDFLRKYFKDQNNPFSARDVFEKVAQNAFNLDKYQRTDSLYFFLNCAKALRHTTDISSESDENSNRTIGGINTLWNSNLLIVSEVLASTALSLMKKNSLDDEKLKTRLEECLNQSFSHGKEAIAETIVKNPGGTLDFSDFLVKSGKNPQKKKKKKKKSTSNVDNLFN